MLMDVLNKAVTVAMLSFVVSVAMGSGLTIRLIIEPLRNARLVLLALLANFVLMPVGALALAKVLWLDDPFGAWVRRGRAVLAEARRTRQGQPRFFSSARWCF
jgi:predicted Na+-dependent transporter